MLLLEVKCPNCNTKVYISEFDYLETDLECGKCGHLFSSKEIIQEGIDSGIAKDFDPQKHLSSLKNKKNKK